MDMDPRCRTIRNVAGVSRRNVLGAPGPATPMLDAQQKNTRPHAAVPSAQRLRRTHSLAGLPHERSRPGAMRPLGGGG